MTEHEASRTLVKSPPELWAECSDAASLARHLGQFGEIRITRLEPETAVAWEGECVSGTVRLEPSGWGTRVILTAQGERSAEPEPVEASVEPEPVEASVEPEPVEVPTPEPEPVEAPEPEPVEAQVSEPVEASVPEPRPIQVVRPAPSRGRRGLIGRLFGFVREPGPIPPGPSAPPVPMPQPRPEPASRADSEPAASPERAASAERAAPRPPEPEKSETADALTAALDSLGQAHHRPFSRS
jgi:hypothetical protein